MQTTILDELEESIYIADPDTYELLYINRACSECFQLDDWSGRKCYHLLYNKEHLCEFCKEGRTVCGRGFPSKIKSIEWNGRPAKLVVIQNNACSIHTDLLTGLNNRLQYMQDLKKPMVFPLGIACIDINGMKKINSLTGNSRGDDILKCMAGLMLQCFDSSGCYRINGDEFVVISQNIEESQFNMQWQKLKYLAAQKTDFSISIGAVWSARQKSIDELLFAADQQMYTAKKSFYRGKYLRGRYRPYLDEVLELSNPQKMKEKIDSGSFLVYYQPKFSTETEKLTGAEALVRYRDKNGKVHTPDHFIPYLEEKELIGILDEYVFRQVCRQIRCWINKGIDPVPVSVNCSQYTLGQQSFIDRLEAACRICGISKDLVELEVTETTELEEKEAFYQNVQQLNHQHFRVAIDDFGIRFANLNLLMHVNFNVLKIDKCVIEKFRLDQREKGQQEQIEKSRLLVEMIIEVCHRMGTRTVAEGVENREDLEILKSVECDEVQGFLFSRPVPENEFYKNFLLPHQSGI